MEQSQVDDPKWFHKPLSYENMQIFAQEQNNFSPKISTAPYCNCRNKSTCCYSGRAILATCSHPSMAFSWMNSCVLQKKGNCCSRFLLLSLNPVPSLSVCFIVTHSLFSCAVTNAWAMLTEVSFLSIRQRWRLVLSLYYLVIYKHAVEPAVNCWSCIKFLQQQYPRMISF